MTVFLCPPVPCSCSGNPIRVQLLRYPDVLFAGYRLPHPLETKLTLKIQVSPAIFASPHVPPARPERCVARRGHFVFQRAAALDTVFSQTKSNTNPHLALMDAMRDLKNELKDLDAAFDAAVATYKDKTNAGAMDY